MSSRKKQAHGIHIQGSSIAHCSCDPKKGRWVNEARDLQSRFFCIFKIFLFLILLFFGFLISSQVRAIKIHKNMNKHKSNANKKILSMTRRKLRNSNEKQPTAMLKIARMMIFKKICIVSSRFRCKKQKCFLSRIGHGEYERAFHLCNAHLTPWKHRLIWCHFYDVLLQNLSLHNPWWWH